MGKGKIGGKYQNEATSSREYLYKFSGYLPNGRRVVGLQVQATNEIEAKKAISQQGYRIDPGSVMRASQFDLVLAANNNKTPKNWTEAKRKAKQRAVK